MTSWKTERDRLLEQTLAFVQGVAAQRPAEAKPAKPTVEPPVRDVVQAPVQPEASATDPSALADAEALMALIAQSLPSLRPEPPKPPVAPPMETKPAQSTKEVVQEPAPVIAEGADRVAIAPTAPAQKPLAVQKPDRQQRLIASKKPERDVIAERVEAFRTKQRKMAEEREAHYARVRAEIDAALKDRSDQ
jgi:hypothetical protein